jgi:hypothetical protein
MNQERTQFWRNRIIDKPKNKIQVPGKLFTPRVDTTITVEKQTIDPN